MTNDPVSHASPALPSPKKGLTTTPAMRRFLIGFAIVEALMMGWALMSSHLR